MWEARFFGFEFYFLVYNFFLYSFCGWIYESTLVSIQHKTWVNRGFLNGPIVPIYGAGATAVYLFLSGIPDEPVLIFVIGMLVATVLEYLTSYVMEKLFHAKWWDYSNYKYHFQGRICLLASLLWGFLSLLMMDVLQPFMNSVIASIPRRAGEIAARLHSFMQKYEKRAELGNIIEKRLLRAFPTMKSTRSEAIITELRKRKRG